MIKQKKKVIISAITLIIGGVIGGTYYLNDKVEKETLYVNRTTQIRKNAAIIDDKEESNNKIEEEKKEEELKKKNELKKQEEEKKQAELKKQQERKKQEVIIKQEVAKKQEVKKEEKPKEVVQNIQPVSGSNIIQSAKSYAVPVREVNSMLNGKKNGQKEVFLTFDDGPSVNTPKVLNILKKYGVHGTFFVLGSNVEGSSTNKEYLKEVYNSGNAIGNHTYSHNFKTLYPGNRVSVTAFMNEINKTNSVLRSVLGSSFNTNVMRMPGGYMSRQYYKDGNLGILNNALNKSGVVSLDWNVDSADASGLNVSSSKIFSNIIKETGNSEDVVVLMHDANGKGTTVQALPEIIEHFKSKGYVFKVISN